MALLLLPKGRLCGAGQKQMCHLCGWLKLFLKKCGGEKNKKLRVGWSVGLPVVELKYGLYVVHVSRWFVYAIWFKFWSVGCLWNGRPTIGYNVSALGAVREWLPQISPRAVYFKNKLFCRFFFLKSFKPLLRPNAC